MKFHSNNNLIFRKGFSLIEAVAALGVLAVITSSVLVIVDQCMNSTADMKLRRNAFEIVRENMEILLTEKTVAEKAEFGVSQRYPAIEWQTTIEMFAPQGSSNKWLKAICSSQYYDSKDEAQTVEFTAWLTMLTKKDVLKIQKNRKILQELEGIDDPAWPDGPGPKYPPNPDGPSPDRKSDPDWWNDPLFKGLPEEFQKIIKADYHNN